MSTASQAMSAEQTQVRGNSPVPAMVRRLIAIAALLTATLGFVGTPGASAYTDCNKLFRSGHGYYGCNDIDHAWDHGTWRSVVYFW